ncbi:MAG: single-stranded-DNA-specific exonuclease RecJ [candidate division WOR-3 bacterium]|nr:single-stranded-DNA-specific exonuclease RecJ [candidate division WOR-3 bacterium]
MSIWVGKHQGEVGEDLIIRGKRIPAVIVQILKNRGYKTAQEIETFFAPTPAELHDPFMFSDMEKAVARIEKALERKERILIHGDYDADGITGMAMLYRNFKKLGLDVYCYIPHRLIEGYGVSKLGIEYALQNGCTLMITVDCGITAFEELNYAKSKNLDVIICDHHNPKSEIPVVDALLNPKLAHCNYPFKELAGVGVVFKFLQGIYRKLCLDEAELLSDLDLVALGSVVDVVPLTGENRYLVKLGLKKMQKSKKAGIQALIKVSGLKGELTAYHLGFIIGPRINACGRLRDAKAALELLLTDDYQKACLLAQELSADNEKRQKVEDEILQEAVNMIEAKHLYDKRVIVLGKENWHEGVVGIVASRIVEEYAKPAIVLTLKEKIAKGSARSVSGFDIAEALNFCADLLMKFGGHKQAAGLELSKSNLDSFVEKINQYAQGFDEHIFMKRHYYDIKLDLKDINEEIVYFLKYFEPTGMENPQPVFLGENFEVVGVPVVVGSDHLKFSLRQERVVFPAIAFYHADKIMTMVPGKTRIDCLYTIFEDSLVGKKKIMLKIKELKNVAVN